MKTITLKYAGKCSSCGKALRKGTAAQWSKTNGVQCIEHADNEDHGLRSMTDVDTQQQDIWADICGR